LLIDVIVVLQINWLPPVLASKTNGDVAQHYGRPL
jgi:hypothetical protein